jgi:hypothetical protein
MMCSDAVINSLKARLSLLQFEALMEKTQQLLQQDGINYIGMVLFPPLSSPLPLFLPLLLLSFLSGEQHKTPPSLLYLSVSGLPSNLS